MLHGLWTYYAPGEVASAVEHIEALVEGGVAPDEAAADAARIYRQRLHDWRTPSVEAHLAAQWRLKRRGGPGPLPCGARPCWQPKPPRYPDEVSLRAFLHRLLHE